jgi:molybdate transport system substrate-binding protein
MRRRAWWLLVSAVGLAACSRGQTGNVSESASTAPIRLAVASNFVPTASELARAFEREHPTIKVELSSGSSGKLYAQIVNGAPFDIFLSADLVRPQHLQAKGRVAEGGLWRYAGGRLVLLGPALATNRDGPSVLQAGAFRHLALAHPQSAPYGAAARQVLERLGQWQRLQPRLVRGENVAQTYQFVLSGAAELGFVPAPGRADERRHAYWLVPAGLHDPIWQAGAVVERRGRHPRAWDFKTFMQSESARLIIAAGGYDGAP